jgi:hypothetical protein
MAQAIKPEAKARPASQKPAGRSTLWQCYTPRVLPLERGAPAKKPKTKHSHRVDLN